MWQADRCVSASTAKQYLYWIARFRRYCNALGLDETHELTRDGVRRFQAWYAHSRGIAGTHLALASSSLRSLRRAYEIAGTPVPPWKPVECRPAPATAVLCDYAAHLGQHRGNPEVTVRKKLDHVGKLLEHLHRSGKSWRQLSLPDIDAFLIGCAHRYARSTTADIASTVRSFARFLLVSGRIRADLADAVISPVQPRFERPRPALPWEDVQRLLRAVDTSTARGLRDHALLLMMSTYGPWRRRSDRPAIAAHRLERRHAADVPPQDRRQLHLATTSAGGQSARSVPASRPPGSYANATMCSFR